LTDWAVDIITTLGYVGVAVLMLVECVFPPIPSEAILPFAGFAVYDGEMTFPLALGAATAGSLVGNLALYLAARRGGLAVVARHGHRVGATPERLARLEAWMDRWGAATVLVGRAIPLARTTVSLPAGLARYPFWRFVILTTIGSLVWNGVLIAIGWALGESWRDVEKALGPASMAVVLVLAAAAVVLVSLAYRRRRLQGRAGD
jgi:membrane protein DedA with SNARE-associated domain